MNAKYQRVAALAIFVLVFWNNAFSQSEVGRPDGTLRSLSARSSILKDIPASSTADTALVNYPGFIGLFANYNGSIYGGWGWTSGQLLQTAFNFGVNGVEDAANIDGFSFQQNIVNNCTVWNSDKVYGILEPPDGHSAVINQPTDTALFEPASVPGMIQGAHRFSRLSKIYPQIAGIIIDDFSGSYLQNNGISTAQLDTIREALHGMSLDANGQIVSGSQATTPNLKLYVVDYQSSPVTYPALDTLIDGVNLFIDNDQSINYVNLDQYVNAVQKTYPGKGILVGVDVSTYSSPASIKGMIQNSIDLYDQGQINGVLLFWGWYLMSQGITQARWDSLAIPPMLDSLYYPYLGGVKGKVVDGSGNPISHARVTVKRIINGDTIAVARKFSDQTGQYTFGGWAGKNSPIKYQLVIEDSAYPRYTQSVELQPQKDTTILNQMQTVTGVSNDRSEVPTSYSLAQNYPNPFNPTTTIKYNLAKPGYVILEVYDVLGRMVANLNEGYEPAGSYSVTFDGSRLASGVYFYRLSAGSYTSLRKMMLLK